MDVNSLVGAMRQALSSAVPSNAPLEASKGPGATVLAQALDTLGTSLGTQTLEQSLSAGGAPMPGQPAAAPAIPAAQVPPGTVPVLSPNALSSGLPPAGLQTFSQGNPLAPAVAQQSAASVVQLSVAASQLSATPAGLPVPVANPNVYYASNPAGQASPLPQGGVNAYIHLLNVLTSGQQDQHSANALTSTLTNASAALRSAYADALSRLSPQLALKDWKFSLADGHLVFEAQGEPLSTQDLTDLQRAFSSVNAQAPARQLAQALLSIQQLRRAGADSGSLAWGGIKLDDSNFTDVVDLRKFLTASAPGGNYSPRLPVTNDHGPMSPVLGGLDLRDMVTMRPQFLRTDGTVRPDVIDEFDEPLVLPENATLHGRCSCGEVSFIVEDAFEYAFYCHCSRCRVRTGSAFAAIGGIGTEKVEVTAGHDSLLIEGECSDGYGARCKRCHAFLFAAVRLRKYIHVSLGVLAEAPTRLPDHHIYVASKATWFPITDGLPQYAELPGP